MNFLFGGDEVNAIVFDVGSHTTRVGYAGEDFPKFDIPSFAGIVETIDGKRDYRFGDCAIKVLNPAMEIKPILRGGVVDDWEAFEQLLEFSFNGCLRCVPAQHPVLFSEHPLNPRSSRERLCELLFEKFDVPAFHVMKTPVLCAFASGKSTALILDVGHDGTSASPVYDGFVIQRAIVQSPLAGNFLLHQCRQLFDEVNLVPVQLIKSKEQVQMNEPANFTLKNKQISESLRDFLNQGLLRDFASTVFQAHDRSPYVEGELEQLPRTTFEFPNGYSSDYGEERFRIPELLFDTRGVPGAGADLGLACLIAASIGLCDIDIRSALYSSIIVVGGTSLMNGLLDRIIFDLPSRVPQNVKFKITTPLTSYEKRFSSFIGGSIVSSLCSFHQRWISKQEYKESGRMIVERKCP